MSSPFLNLPGELRTEIYSLVLLHPDPIRPWSFSYDTLNPSLFLVNKSIHHETIPLFYSQNRFTFTYDYSEEIATFLLKIGPNNANSIRHICISFPEFRCLKTGDVSLEYEGVEVLTAIQSGCASLTTLTMSPRSIGRPNAKDFMLDVLAELDGDGVREAVKLVNTHLRVILSLQKIVVEVDAKGPIDVVRREMESHGWIIKAVDKAWEEEEDRTVYGESYSYTILFLALCCELITINKIRSC
jgi:hypothetical protein